MDNTINAVDRLRDRITCNQPASRSFHDFVLDLLELDPDDVALDLGSGLGQQLLPVAAKARRVVGVDVSAELVEALRGRLTGSNAEIVVGDMDRLGALGIGGPFSLAYAVYSLYYSADAAAVVRTVAGLLDGPRTRFVAVAPDVGNNAAWYADLDGLYGLTTDVLESPTLCRQVFFPAFLESFPTVCCSTFASEVRFSDLDALMRYYDACAPYCRPDRRAEAREFFGQKFERDGSYTIRKHSMGLVGRPGPRS